MVSSGIVRYLGSVWWDMGAVGQVLGRLAVEIAAPAAVTAVVTATRVPVIDVVDVVDVFVVRVSHHLVGHVFFLVEEFLQSNDRCQHQSELKERESKVDKTE